jgi:endonuclease/exonuclease/phosphatase family metal-dependent hydrolase
VLLLLLGGFVLWASGGTTDHREVASFDVQVLVEASANGESFAPPDLTAITFNIGYGRGPAGDDSGPWTREHIERHLDGIAEQIRASGAHVAALQEVDMASARSRDIDEPRYLAEKLGWPNYACVLTWENNYVPYPYWPPSRHYGRMKSGQCVLARLPIRSNTRYRLPQPAKNPFYYNWFYLHRAIQVVEIEAGGGRVLEVVNVHLEAFDPDNRELQVETLKKVLEGGEPAHRVILGDFNALPPGTTKRHGFEDEPDADFRGDESMERVYGFADMTEAVTASGGAPDDPATFTFPAQAPSRRLDYVFAGRGVRVESARVLSEPPVWSDHLPIVARLRLVAPGT